MERQSVFTDYSDSELIAAMVKQPAMIEVAYGLGNVEFAERLTERLREMERVAEGRGIDIGMIMA